MRFSDAYAAALPAAASLLAPRYLHQEGRFEATEARAGRIDPAVVADIRRVNERLQASEVRNRHLNELSADRVACVVTGQQCGLFGGPLYAAHKAAAAIRLAARLREETGTPVVPIFWLQAEDHDIAEIATHHTVRRDGSLVSSTVWPLADASRCSIDQGQVPETITRALDEVEVAWENLPYGDPVADWLRARWKPGASWVEAFARTIGDLFADEGLVVLHPRTPVMAQAAMPVHRWAIEAHPQIARALEGRAAHLETAGFGAQVPVRPDCALSFVHVEGTTEGRYRLRSVRDGLWEGAGHGAALTSDTLNTWLEEEPMRFSTSALLRPLVQDTLLPTAAYVGGPSEVAYLAELAPLYELRHLPMPLVVPRPSWFWVPRATRSTLDEYGLDAHAFDAGLDACLKRLGADEAPGPTAEVTEKRLMDAFEAELARIEAELEGTDPLVGRAARKTRKTVSRYVGRFARNVGRARERADRERLRVLEEASGWLRPGGSPQERTIGFGAIAAQVGLREFAKACLENADPIVQNLSEVPL